MLRIGRFCRSASTSVRGNYSQHTPEDVARFRSIVGENHVITNPDDLKASNTDWLRKYTGRSGVLVKPRTTAEVSAVLQHCNARKLAVVPQGGVTGLVGGSVPVFDEVIINMSRMNSVLGFDADSGIITVESGCILGSLTSYLEERGFTMPLDLGAKHSAHIGGNISTNAGGLRLLRYGSLHGTVLGVEAVLADGTVVDALSSLRKDNTGYDVKQLFIGSEGHLGIVTKASILTPPKPKNVQVAWLSMRSFADVVRLMTRARTELAEIISAIEFVDNESLNAVLSHIPGTRDPLANGAQSTSPFYVLIETSGSVAEHDTQKLEQFLEKTMDDQLVQQGSLAQDQSQMLSIWKLRESIAESLCRIGAVYKYDISLPVRTMYDMVEALRQRVKHIPNVGVYGYGHVGDGNLHVNIVAPDWSDEVAACLEPFIFEQTASHKGSISAEHGMGQAKNEFMSFSKSSGAIDVMQRMKRMLDPNGILNPYKVLPSSVRA